MAIKGYLSDITFVELLKVIGNHNGRLVIWDFEKKKQYECFLLDKTIIYLNFCGQVISTNEPAKDIFLGLNADKKSYYAFQADSFAASLNNPIISVSELINFLLLENPEADESLLPNLYTRFETVNKVDFTLQGGLAAFWKDSIKLLHKGCSASEICAELGLDEKTVRQNLYKLRTTGLIRPVRMFNANNSSFARSRATRQNLSRFAGSLNGTQQTANAETLSPAMQKPAIAIENTLPSNGATWQNAYENNSYPKKPQPLSQPVLKENRASTFEMENIPTPACLIQDETPVTLIEPKVLSKPMFDTQFEDNTADQVLALPLAQAKPAAVETSSLSGVQFPVSDAQTVSGQPVNMATNTPDIFQKEITNHNHNTAPKMRVGLIKRMLSSLFKN